MMTSERWAAVSMLWDNVGSTSAGAALASRMQAMMNGNRCTTGMIPASGRVRGIGWVGAEVAAGPEAQAAAAVVDDPLVGETEEPEGGQDANSRTANQ